MEKKVIRSGVFVKIIGIITTAIFSLVSLFLAITGNIMASICFLPFAALGDVYKRQGNRLRQNGCGRQIRV